MYRRIENYYHWKTLEQWKTVLESGMVQRRVIEEEAKENILLENAIEMLVNNCFPVAIVCYRNKERKKEIQMTPLWVEIFDFLEGRRYIRKENEEISFKDMENCEQKAILNAWIQSVWMTEE